MSIECWYCRNEILCNQPDCLSGERRMKCSDCGRALSYQGSRECVRCARCVRMGLK